MGKLFLFLLGALLFYAGITGKYPELWNALTRDATTTARTNKK